MDKELLKKLGEETIYSAKGHFKSCDIRRNLTTFTIWFCTFINVLGIIGFTPVVGKILSVMGLLGMISLLLWNEGDGKNYRSKHKRFGEAYLSIHKEIRAYYLLSEYDKDEIEKLSQKVMELDSKNKPDISILARKWAKKAIEENGETDNWYTL